MKKIPQRFSEKIPKKAGKVYDDLVEKLFFSETVPFYVEGYFEIVLITCLCFKANLFSTFGEVISSLLMMYGFFITLFIPALSIWIMF